VSSFLRIAATAYDLEQQIRLAAHAHAEGPPDSRRPTRAPKVGCRGLNDADVALRNRPTGTVGAAGDVVASSFPPGERALHGVARIAVSSNLFPERLESPKRCRGDPTLVSTMTDDAETVMSATAPRHPPVARMKVR